MTPEKENPLEDSEDNNLEKKTPKGKIINLLTWITREETGTVIDPELKIIFSKGVDLTSGEKLIVVNILKKFLEKNKIQEIPANTEAKDIKNIIRDIIHDFGLEIILKKKIAEKITDIITTIFQEDYDYLTQEIPEE